MNIGEKIRALRTIRNLSQDNLAADLNLSLNAYSKIERGETKSINQDILEKIAEILGVTVSGLYAFGENGMLQVNGNIGSVSNGLVSNSSVYHHHADTDMLIELERLRTENAGLKKEVSLLNEMLDMYRRSER